MTIIENVNLYSTQQKITNFLKICQIYGFFKNLFYQSTLLLSKISHIKMTDSIIIVFFPKSFKKIVAIQSFSLKGNSIF